jgi:hypothetical protein
VRQIVGHSDDAPAVAPPRRYRVTQSCQHSSGSRGIPNTSGFDLKRHGQHPTTDISADSLRIYRVRRANDHSDADVFGEMDVGHHSDVLHVRRAP